MIQYLYRNFHESIFHVQYFFAKLFSILFSKFGFLAKFSHFNLPSSEFFSQCFWRFFFLRSVFFFAKLFSILFSKFSFLAKFSHFNLPSSVFFRNAFDDSFFYVQFFFAKLFSFHFKFRMFRKAFLNSIFKFRKFRNTF